MNTRENKDLYAGQAKVYDIFDRIFLLGGKGNPREGLVEEIENPASNILDVCVGTAASSIVIASHFAQSRIIGIDISDAMLSVARKKIAENQLKNVELKNSPADDLPFADGSFDLVMVSFALHEFEYSGRKNIFNEAARVLRPGGKFCVIDFARQNNTSNRIFMKLWTLIEPSCFSGFLNMDWQKGLEVFDLHYLREKEYSLSKLYVLQKG